MVTHEITIHRAPRKRGSLRCDMEFHGVPPEWGPDTEANVALANVEEGVYAWQENMTEARTIRNRHPVFTGRRRLGESS